LKATEDLNLVVTSIMIVGVIQASSQTNKNNILFDAVKKYATGHEVINFGCFPDDIIKYSYIEISIEIGILLASKAVDFVVTGCSSGQGMMLACNNMPGVICGYAPTPKDAYLFAQINNGNAISLPLGEEYTYSGSENCKKTVEMLFYESFGQGYPKDQAARKISDAKLLKSVKEKSQVDFITLLERLDDNLITKVLQKKNVVDHVLNNGTDIATINWIKQHI
jgi:ribose 5-phosphate isomerase RpiB